MEIYIPKGGMCRVCKRINEDCSQLPFATMNIIDWCGHGDDSVYTVACTSFERPTLQDTYEKEGM